jgi:hypothetical protein
LLNLLSFLKKIDDEGNCWRPDIRTRVGGGWVKKRERSLGVAEQPDGFQGTLVMGGRSALWKDNVIHVLLSVFHSDLREEAHRREELRRLGSLPGAFYRGQVVTEEGLILMQGLCEGVARRVCHTRWSRATVHWSSKLIKVIFSSKAVALKVFR